MRAIQKVVSAALAASSRRQKMPRRHRRLPATDPAHRHRQRRLRPAGAYGVARCLRQRAIGIFVLDQDVARFPRQFRDGAGQDDAPDRRVPVGGRVEGHLRGPEAVALQDKGAVAERLSGRDCGLDVAPDLEKIVGVDVLVVLPCADRQRRKSARREGAGGRPQLQRGEIAAAAVHLNEQRRRRRRLCQRLPQRGGDPEPVDCAD